MANTEIRLGGLASGLTAAVVVKDPDTLAILESVALTEVNSATENHYAGTVTAAIAGRYLFAVTVSGHEIEERIRSIADDVGPYVISSFLEQGSGDLSEVTDQLDEIQAQTDQIGAVTFVASGNSVSSNGEIVIKAGDRHVFTFTSNTPDVVPDLTGQMIRFGIRGNGGDQLLEEVDNVQVLQGTGLQSVEVTLVPAKTILLAQGGFHFDLQAEYAPDDHRTFFTGSVTVRTDYSGVPTT